MVQETYLTLAEVPRVETSLVDLLKSSGQPIKGIDPSITFPVLDWSGVTDAGLLELKKLIPSVNKDYLFQKDIMRDFCAWYHFNEEALFLYGPPGSGKSSFAKQIYGMLQMPLMRFTISADTELDALFGHYVLAEGGETVFRYGPASMAAKFGCPVLFDEIGRGNPSVVVGLNGFLEERFNPFIIPGNGETVVPVDGFCVILTDNTNLTGDSSGSFHTAFAHDASTTDRIGMAIYVDYPHKEERQMLLGCLEELLGHDDDELTEWFQEEGIQVKTQNGIVSGSAVTRDIFIDGILQVRDMIRKQSRDCGNMDANALERTISVRSLRRWLSYCIAFMGAPAKDISALHYAMQRALTNTCTPSTKVAIHGFIQAVFNVAPMLK